jgi:hypothetical protein
VRRVTAARFSRARPRRRAAVSFSASLAHRGVHCAHGTFPDFVDAALARESESSVSQRRGPRRVVRAGRRTPRIFMDRASLGDQPRSSTRQRRSTTSPRSRSIAAARGRSARADGCGRAVVAATGEGQRDQTPRARPESDASPCAANVAERRALTAAIRTRLAVAPPRAAAPVAAGCPGARRPSSADFSASPPAR